jgi:hypothetical protein
MLAEGEELSSNPLRAFFNGLRTTQIGVDVAWRISGGVQWSKDEPMRGPATDLDPNHEQGGNSNVGNTNVIVRRDPATGEIPFGSCPQPDPVLDANCRHLAFGDESLSGAWKLQGRSQGAG